MTIVISFPIIRQIGAMRTFRGIPSCKNLSRACFYPESVCEKSMKKCGAFQKIKHRICIYSVYLQ